MKFNTIENLKNEEEKEDHLITLKYINNELIMEQLKKIAELGIIGPEEENNLIIHDIDEDIITIDEPRYSIINELNYKDKQTRRNLIENCFYYWNVYIQENRIKSYFLTQYTRSFQVKIIKNWKYEHKKSIKIKESYKNYQMYKISVSIRIWKNRIKRKKVLKQKCPILFLFNQNNNFLFKIISLKKKLLNKWKIYVLFNKKINYFIKQREEECIKYNFYMFKILLFRIKRLKLFMKILMKSFKNIIYIEKIKRINYEKMINKYNMIKIQIMLSRWKKQIYKRIKIHNITSQFIKYKCKILLEKWKGKMNLKKDLKLLSTRVSRHLLHIHFKSLQMFINIIKFEQKYQINYKKKTTLKCLHVLRSYSLYRKNLQDMGTCMNIIQSKLFIKRFKVFMERIKQQKLRVRYKEKKVRLKYLNKWKFFIQRKYLYYRGIELLLKNYVKFWYQYSIKAVQVKSLNYKSKLYFSTLLKNKVIYALKHKINVNKKYKMAIFHYKKIKYMKGMKQFILLINYGFNLQKKLKMASSFIRRKRLEKTKLFWNKYIHELKKFKIIVNNKYIKWMYKFLQKWFDSWLQKSIIQKKLRNIIAKHRNNLKKIYLNMLINRMKLERKLKSFATYRILLIKLKFLKIWRETSQDIIQKNRRLLLLKEKKEQKCLVNCMVGMKIWKKVKEIESIKILKLKQISYEINRKKYLNRWFKIYIRRRDLNVLREKINQQLKHKILFNCMTYNKRVLLNEQKIIFFKKTHRNGIASCVSYHWFKWKKQNNYKIKEKRQKKKFDWIYLKLWTRKIFEILRVHLFLYKKCIKCWKSYASFIAVKNNNLGLRLRLFRLDQKKIKKKKIFYGWKVFLNSIKKQIIQLRTLKGTITADIKQYKKNKDKSCRFYFIKSLSKIFYCLVKMNKKRYEKVDLFFSIRMKRKIFDKIQCFMLERKQLMLLKQLQSLKSSSSPSITSSDDIIWSPSNKLSIKNTKINRMTFNEIEKRNMKETYSEKHKDEGSYMNKSVPFPGSRLNYVQINKKRFKNSKLSNSDTTLNKPVRIVPKPFIHNNSKKTKDNFSIKTISSNKIKPNKELTLMDIIKYEY